MYLGNIQPSLQLDVIKKVENPAIIAADSMNLWIDLFPKQVWELISKVNIFMLNDEEARQLTGETNLEKISEKFLSLGPKIVIIKMGGKKAHFLHSKIRNIMCQWCQIQKYMILLVQEIVLQEESLAILLDMV